MKDSLYRVVKSLVDRSSAMVELCKVKFIHGLVM